MKALDLISWTQLQILIQSIPELTQKNRTKELHDVLKTLMRLKKRPPMVEGIINDEGILIEDQVTSHNAITAFFQERYNDEGIKRKFENLEAPNIKLTFDDFDKIISHINKKKGNGYDYIPLSILNKTSGKEFLCSVVNDLFNQITPEHRVFTTRLMLLSKSGTLYPRLREIRPIAVTTAVQKIIEHVILGKLEAEMGSSISETQFGFRKQKETSMHVLRLLDRLKTFKETKMKRFTNHLVFIDFSNAFDAIDHEILLKNGRPVRVLKGNVKSIKMVSQCYPSEAQ
ncbi:MAG TPA: reverse transcriptase domain-containing protein [Candidatus Dojkabacteria bacterium]|nr:reverse transcriptase domain-containing protein [Candidatus Dojkabacteria bacterium]